ncbi:hypothetical protein DFH08DRAFT_319634 [Mycena albidolilacea]|uniref:Uncharacterized protein n=1 Tax=Mycena albidolilacea TaxID=1033008 RepID=A0AAD6ZLM2_9AGAR|nr:hypothetical protein DFH08DRAFT_319634 [Mycena albidolilacea]
MYNNPTLQSTATAHRDGGARLPLGTEDETDRLGTEAHVLRNVGAVRTVRPNTKTAVQGSREGAGDQSNIPGGESSSRNHLPEGSRRLPRTPVPKVGGGYDGAKEERARRVERFGERTAKTGTRADTSENPAHQTFGVRLGQEEPRTTDNIRRTETHEIRQTSHPDCDSKPFSVSADSISFVEAVCLAERLNANIFQASALIADSLECVPAKDSASTVLGRHLGLGESVAQKLPSADPGIVQIALLAAIARWCKNRINSWCLEDERVGKFLSGLYEKILHSETSTTAHRWRAITRAQTKSSDEDILLASSLIECICDVMVYAGWKIHEAESDRREFIHNRFEGQIAAISKYSLQLRTAIGEELVSEDLEVAYVEPSHAFEERTMEDTYATVRVEDRSHKAIFDIVACTTDIGLQRRKNISCEAKVLLRPKVVLQSALDEL